MADSIDNEEHCWNPGNRVEIGVMSDKKPQKNRTAKAEHRCRDHCARTTDIDLPAEIIRTKSQQVQMDEKGDIGGYIKGKDTENDVWRIKQARLYFCNQRNATHQVWVP